MSDDLPRNKPNILFEPLPNESIAEQEALIDAREEHRRKIIESNERLLKICIERSRELKAAEAKVAELTALVEYIETYFPQVIDDCRAALNAKEANGEPE